jgi:hypothetical protein
MTRRPPETRLSFIIILVFGLVASKGCDIINQALASVGAARPVLDSAVMPDVRGQPSNSESSGVRLSARTETAARFLMTPLTPTSIGPAREAVTAVLQVAPLAGIFWLRLAEIRAASGTGVLSIIDAYRLAVLVAPFDGRMMLARQVLGVQLWDVLPTDDRRSVVTDLLGVWTMRPAELTDQLRAATATVSPDGRRTMRATLRSRSDIPDRQLAAIGL